MMKLIIYVSSSWIKGDLLLLKSSRVNQYETHAVQRIKANPMPDCTGVKQLSDRHRRHRLMARIVLAQRDNSKNVQELAMKTRRKARVVSKSSPRAGEFTLAKLGKGCWVVGYQGRMIAGAVLSSLPAAAAYAADLAHAFGRHNFLMTVVEAGRQAV